jgi:S-layer homology domain
VKPRSPSPFAAVGVLLLAAYARGQSYGPDAQTWTVGGANFDSKPTDLEAYHSTLDSDGYLMAYYDLPFVLGYEAPLDLPDGSRIEQVCLFSRGDGLDVVTVSLKAVKLVPPGGTASEMDLPGTVLTTNPAVGYSRDCTDPISLTVRSTADVDGDGLPDAVSCRVGAIIQNLVPSGAGLGAVQVTWRREVSPPPMTPTFADVPSSEGAWPEIEALAASGITAGCGGGDFCPAATLTRRQMAVFLAQALGLHWGTP